MVVRYKRGKSALALLFYALFTLMLAAFFVIVVMGKVKSAANNSEFHKRFYSRDIALLVDSMHASSGDLEIDYAAYTKGNMPLDINLGGDSVVLTDYSDTPFEQRDKTEFLFGYNNYVDIIPSRAGSTPTEFMIVIKNGNLSIQPKGGK